MSAKKKATKSQKTVTEQESLNLTPTTTNTNHQTSNSNYSKQSSNPVPNKRPADSTEMIAYVHRISPLKRNRSNTLDYFNLQLQSSDSIHRSVCFCRSKRSLFLERQQTKTAVKLQKYTVYGTVRLYSLTI